MNLIPREFDNLHAVQKKSLINPLLFFLLVMPAGFWGIFTLYANETPDLIAYKWLDFRFGIMSILLLFFGIIIHSSQKRVELLIVILFWIREFVFFLMGESNCFSEDAYEIYLVIVLSFCMVNIVSSINITLMDKQAFLLRIIFLNILIVYLSYLFHLNGIADRYNATNMDVEATGVICGLAAIFCLFKEDLKHRYILAIIALGGLILSGSRVNLLITGLVIMFGFFQITMNKRRYNRSFLLNVIFICSTVIFALIGVGVVASLFNIELPFIGSTVVKRMVDAVSVSGMESDSSVLGRSRSIYIGFEIMKNHPFGISGFFTNLQLETQKYGFPTFPHSTFLTYYILLGPIIIALIVWMVRIMFKTFRADSVMFLGVLYLFMFFCISGGPIVSFKPIFFYLFFLTIADTISASQKINGISFKRGD